MLWNLEIAETSSVERGTSRKKVFEEKHWATCHANPLAARPSSRKAGTPVRLSSLCPRCGYTAPKCQPAGRDLSGAMYPI